MKKILFLALFAAVFFSCAKEPQQLSQTSVDATNALQSEITHTEVFTASDRDQGVYQFGLTNCSLSSYCFTLTVRDLQTGNVVTKFGGCYTGNTFYSIYMTPGQNYAATLSFTPPHPEQKGTIHWWIRNYMGYVMCAQGDMGIPSSQSLFWAACQ